MVLALDNLELSIRHNDAFFASIIDMIPRDLYKPVEEEDEEVLNKRYHKHRKMPLQLEEKKALSKKRLKEIYEPKGSVVNKEEDGDDEGAASLETPSALLSERESPEVEDDAINSVDDGLDALRKRLQDRISSLKGKRSNPSGRNDKDKKGQKQIQKNKPSKVPAIVEGENATAENVAKSVSRGVLEDMLQGEASEEVENSGDISYSGLVDSSVAPLRADYGKSGSKMRRLKKLIEDTESKKKRLNDLKSQGDEGKQQALQEQWTDVLKEASGTKVLANTQKIKNTIKRKEKAKEKSARMWAERTSKVESDISKRQEKREDNLLKRKRGPDWIPPAGEEEQEKPTSGAEKKRGIPIKSGFGSFKQKGDQKAAAGKGSSGGAKPGRPGFEGKKADFLNKKPRK